MKDWLLNHNDYSSILVSNPIPSEILMNGEREGLDFLVNSYLKAASFRPGENLDPDVQTGLGVLLNLRESMIKLWIARKPGISRSRGFLLVQLFILMVFMLIFFFLALYLFQIIGRYSLKTPRLPSLEQIESYLGQFRKQ